MAGPALSRLARSWKGGPGAFACVVPTGNWGAGRDVAHAPHRLPRTAGGRLGLEEGAPWLDIVLLSGT